MKSITLVIATTALVLAPVHAQEAPPATAVMVQDRPAPPPPPPSPPRPADETGQAGDRTPPPPPSPPPPPAERITLPTRNVRVDVTITEQSGSNPPMKKLVSFVVADGRSSGVRSMTNVTYARRTSPSAPAVYNQRGLPLNVDSTVRVTPDQRVLLDLRFNYGSLQPATQEALTATGGDSIAMDSLFGEITENLSVLLSPGVPVVVSRSADATSDRTVTVEVKADILK